MKCWFSMNKTAHFTNRSKPAQALAMTFDGKVSCLSQLRTLCCEMGMFCRKDFYCLFASLSLSTTYVCYIFVKMKGRIIKNEEISKYFFEAAIQSDWTKKKESFTKYGLGQKTSLPHTLFSFCFRQWFYGKIKVLKDSSIFCEYFKCFKAVKVHSFTQKTIAFSNVI